MKGDPSRIHRGEHATDVDVAASGMCQGGPRPCPCDAGGDCLALERYGDLAVRAVDALGRRYRLIRSRIPGPRL